MRLHRRHTAFEAGAEGDEGMGEILGVGMSHYPGFSLDPKTMGRQIVGNIERCVERGWAHPKWREPSNWPAPLQEEWGDDNGVAAGIKHRAVHLDAVKKAREAVDAFRPDIVLIWGDDQWENYHEDLVPPFAVYAWDEMNNPHRRSRFGGTNVWGEPDDKVFTYPGNRKAGKYLVNKLMDEGFDIAYSYGPLHRDAMSHAFFNSLLYLDDDRKGWDYPVIPFHINCYGDRFVISRGTGGPVPDGVELDPNAPSPKRCFDMGAAVARVFKESSYKAVLIGSSSWSHGGLTASHEYIWPDLEADGRLLERLQANDLASFRDLTTEQLIEAGQVEVPNWCAVIGAMHELGQKAEIVSYAPSHIFNSSKCVALFQPAGG